MVKIILRHLKFIIPLVIILSFFGGLQYKKSVRIEEALAGPHVKINKTVIAVEVADSPGEQYRGLSNRKSLNKHQGMLFVFNNQIQRVFVMREMNFPLDILWIKDGEIVKISENLPPEGKNPENSYGSEYEVNHVLELNAGFSRKNKIETGDKIEINI
ncbi:MAG: DUF192 domain-containing protein [Patescibacteria group bacterium]|nr:DUF192 domain-containing protein [Patescibacteria group bacterium]